MSTGDINGVDTAHLLFARGVVGDTPAAGDYTWRASNEWVHGTHSKTTIDGYFGLGEERNHKGAYEFEADHPLEFNAADNAATPVEIVLAGLASCLTAGVAAVAEKPRDQAPLGQGHARGRHEHRRHPRSGPRCQERVQRRPGQLPDRRRRYERGRPRGAGGAVAEDLGGLRHHDQSHQRDRKRQLRRPIRSHRMRTTTVVIGAGHTGLAASYFLSARGIDHVVLERGEVANTWRTERWDSLRLLTPNLAGHPARSRLRRWRSRRLHDRSGAGGLHRSVRPVGEPTSLYAHHRHLGPPGRGGVRGGDRPRRVAVPVRDTGQRGLQPAQGAPHRRCPSRLGAFHHRARVPAPLRPRRWRCSGGGSFRHRHPARRGDPSIRTSGHRVGGGSMSGCPGPTEAGISGTGWT